ncbi:MAG: methanogenesis marker protein Mmp4/MtxX [Candidatus Lokiarchaeota archaeon]|nr:methanogenesis marker protein Mmp4/MtxX [Candidatus Lokiarchaeota archaeon]
MIQKFKEAAKEKRSNIGIGLGTSEYHNQKILQASLNFVALNKANVYIFGNSNFINILLEQTPKNYLNSRVNFIECQTPERVILTFLINKTIQSIVRGSMSSNKFLKSLKKNLNIRETYRLALLETINEHQFFFGPVGIDECKNFENKIKYLDLAIKKLQEFDTIPKISILSGGRTSDTGRNSKVDKTIQDAEKIVELLKNKYSNLKISHDEILIEKAIESKSNLIIAPDGLSGNLIYRTLVHLGGGKAYGAIYMGLRNTIIDTSRVGDFSEIQGALLLALALSK